MPLKSLLIDESLSREEAAEQNGKFASVFSEVQRLASASIEEEAVVSGLKNITAKDLAEIRALKNPPICVQRTLEATCLLLNAARASRRLEPPSWAAVQKMFGARDTLQRMLNYDIDVLRTTPALVAYVASEYFYASASHSEDVVMRRSSAIAPVEPLTYERVNHANRAAAALFRWGTFVVHQAGVSLQASTHSDVEAATSTGVAAEEVHCNMQSVAADPVVLGDSLKFEKLPSEEAAEMQQDVEPGPFGAELVEAEEMALLLPVKTEACIAALPEKRLRPDRCFQEYVAFPNGSSDITPDMEHTLQTLAATVCMRRSLKLRLLGATDVLQGNALARSQLQAIEDYFDAQCIPCIASPGTTKVCGDIVCQLLLDDDPQLCDLFLGVVSDADTSEVGTWLEENFDCCMLEEREDTF